MERFPFHPVRFDQIVHCRGVSLVSIDHCAVDLLTFRVQLGNVIPQLIYNCLFHVPGWLSLRQGSIVQLLILFIRLHHFILQLAHF